MQLFMANASTNIDSWFDDPRQLENHSETAFARELLIFWPQSSPPNRANTSLNSQHLEYLLEQVTVVEGKSDRVDGTLGLELEGGSSFEELKRVWKRTNKELDRTRNISADTNPLRFFQEVLAPLLSNSTNITYVDQYIWSHASDRVKPKVKFIELLMSASPRATIRLLSNNTQGSSDEIKESVRQTFTLLKSKSSFEGDVSISFTKWDHGRWLIFNVGPGRQLALDFSFSLDYWSRPIFKTDQRLGLRKYRWDENEELNKILELCRGRLWSTSLSL